MTPVAVFAYNRKDKIEQCLYSLSECNGAKETEVFIFSDGPKNEVDSLKVGAIRTFLYSFEKRKIFKSLSIREAKYNKGLANSLIEGISYVLSKYNAVIVIEDDLVFSKDFLQYMNNALNFFESDMRIGEISGYRYPIKEINDYQKDAFFLKKGECWGWGTWKNRWDKVDWNVKDFDYYVKHPSIRRKFDNLELGFDDMLLKQRNGMNDSWAIRWCYHLFKNNLYVVFPKYSKVNNCGFDGTGTHCSNCSNGGKFSCEFSEQSMNYIFQDTKYEKKYEKEMSYYPMKIYGGLLGIIRHLLFRELKYIKEAVF